MIILYNTIIIIFMLSAGCSILTAWNEEKRFPDEGLDLAKAYYIIYIIIICSY